LIDRAGGLGPYVPKVASSWDAIAPGSRWCAVKGTLVFVDISGFTSLSERLAQRGRVGAEELTSILDRVFGDMLRIVTERGGSLLKFGGDALLLLFDTDDHLMQACAAAVEMRRALRSASDERTSVGRINLKMSSGIHTGSIDLFMVGGSHRELIVAGPAASKTTAMESTADAGEIVVSDTVRQALPPDFVGARKGNGWLLAKRRINVPLVRVDPSPPEDEADLANLVPASLRDHLQSNISGSEHRIATIGFLKFTGVDALLATHDPDQTAGELQRLIDAVQSATEAEGVTFLASDIDSDGGKIILATGVPASRHDDEGRMLRAVRAIVECDTALSLRVGVNRGHVFSSDVGTDFRRTFTVMGDTVNLAARLMSAAGSGQIYATPAVLTFSSTLFHTDPLQPFHVKGKEHPVQAFVVGEEVGVRPPVLNSDLPFKGRDAEMQLLVGIVNTCSRLGRGGIMTITGDVGVGKSRLISEVLDACAGIDRLIIQAEPAGIDNPYWAFRDPLRRLLGVERSTQENMVEQLTSSIESATPELAWALPLLGDVTHIEIADNPTTAVIDPRFRPERTADVVVDLLSRRGTRPVALVAEDGQWLDDASLSLLARIGEEAAERPWTVMVTARTGESEFEPIGNEITLKPLDDASIKAIAVEATQATPLRPHELDELVTKAGGNPLFLNEILRVVSETGTADELPDSLDAVISREIDTLPPLPRQLLRYASVLGRRFRRPELDEFLAPERVQLDVATVRELGRFMEEDDEGRLTFRHSVVHDIAYGSLSYSKRRELHARAGDVIERQAGDDPEAVAGYLATHYSQSGEYSKAWHYALVAGDRAKGAYANSEAASHYRKAIDAAHFIDVSPDERARVHQLLGEVLDRLGDFNQALVSYRRAQHSYTSPQLQANVLWMQAATLKRMGQLSRALATLTRGLKLATAEGIEDVSIDLLAERAAIRQYQGRHKEAIKWAEEALSMPGRERRPEAVALSEITADWARTLLGQPDGHSATRRALHLAEEIGDLHIQGLALNNLGVFAYYESDWDEAVRLYEKSSSVSAMTGDAVLAAYGKANIAEILSEQGHLDEADREFAEVLPVFRSAGDQWMTGLVLSHQGRIEARRGRIKPAVKRFDEALEIYESMGASVERVEVMLRKAEALVHAGLPAQARQLLDAKLGLAPEAASSQIKPLAYRVSGLTAWASGDSEAGFAGLQAALDLAEELESVQDQVAALNAMGAVGIADPAQSERVAELSARLGMISAPIILPSSEEGLSVNGTLPLLGQLAAS
jgi:class 3 adenylate cyclase/tetratricopeptide (TPR) repeat protein